MITTGKLYRHLFSDYSDELFNQSVKLQADRFTRWGLPVENSICLDVGCGGGRTLVALKNMGAKKVYGIDIDDELVELAKRRSGADVVKGSALQLPHQSNLFDVVICSGVLHHTPDMKRGIDEIRRVLKPDGTLYLLLYIEDPYWKITRLMRRVAKVIPFSIMRRLLFFIPPNKRYNTMDNWYVEYMQTPTRAEVYTMLGEFHGIQEVDKGNPPHNIRLIMRKFGLAKKANV